MTQASLAECVNKTRICLHRLCDLASSFVLSLQPFSTQDKWRRTP